jgi:hypothetical protein
MRQFTAEVIIWAVRWYLMFPVSYRDLELMLLDRGVPVDHTTIFRWIPAAPRRCTARRSSRLGTRQPGAVVAQYVSTPVTLAGLSGAGLGDYRAAGCRWAT